MGTRSVGFLQFKRAPSVGSAISEKVWTGKVWDVELVRGATRPAQSLCGEDFQVEDPIAMPTEG